MKRNTWAIALVIAALVVGGCGFALGNAAAPAPAQASAAPAVTGVSYNAAPAAATAAAPVAVTSNPTLAAFEQTFEQIYQNVSPSVVTIEVLTGGTGSAFGQQGGGLGSGFVWDKQGHIVTNNHVIAGATQITVVFSDGFTTSGTVVGADPQSDLAVVKVNVPASRLVPVTLADSNAVKVGQIAIAIGNPFGEQSTMTTGIISALGRYLPVDQNATGPSYTIPDVIQTDAPINPGNSGGVLLNADGQVIGVTAAIESATQSSAGIGFAIPSSVVKSVVPALISTGHYDHSYLGISGTTLTPDLATAMNLNENQQGALVATVTAGGPSAAAGLQGSTQTVTIAGQQVEVGGDVITAINGQPVKSFNDLVAYLAESTQPGQKVTLTILRNGKQETVDVTLGTRPSTTTAPQATVPQGNTNPFFGNPNRQTPVPSTPNQTTGAYLGIYGLSMNSQLAQAMNLPTNQTGVLVSQVQAGTPAAAAGLMGGSQTATINGQTVQVGGDVITAIDGQQINTIGSLQSYLAQAQSGQSATLTILRNGQQMKLSVTLGAAPTSNQ